MRVWHALLLLLISMPLHPFGHAITEPISVSNVVVTDQSGLQNLPGIGEEGNVEASLANNTDETLTGVVMLLVKDSVGNAVHLSWTELSVASGESVTTTQPFTIDTEGVYTAEILVWNSMETPTPLTYSPNSFMLDFAPVSPCKGTGDCFEGMVTKVVDGDTIDVDGKRIRLALVDTPERGDEGYSEATNFTSKLCPVDSQVLVDQDGNQMFDAFDRMVAVIYCDGALLNAELLFAEHAVIDKDFCKVSEFGNEDWAILFGC
jgi:endonuclease YncB( thermonuclease family)